MNTEGRYTQSKYTIHVLTPRGGYCTWMYLDVRSTEYVVRVNPCECAVTLRNETSTIPRGMRLLADCFNTRKIPHTECCMKHVSNLPKGGKLPQPLRPSVNRKSACNPKQAQAMQGLFVEAFEAVTGEEVEFCIRFRAETSSLSPLIDLIGTSGQLPRRMFAGGKRSRTGCGRQKRLDMLRTDLPPGTRTGKSKRWSNNPIRHWRSRALTLAEFEASSDDTGWLKRQIRRLSFAAFRISVYIHIHDWYPSPPACYQLDAQLTPCVNESAQSTR